MKSTSGIGPPSFATGEMAGSRGLSNAKIGAMVSIRTLIFWGSALVASSSVGFATAQTPRESPNLASIDAPNTQQFIRLCTNTADPADCGKKVEAQQLKQSGADKVARRDGKFLAITIPGEPPFIFEDVDSEAGPNTSFYSYSAGADAVVVYRARGDKVEFLLLHRPTGSVTELPNEPKFNRDGRYFATADFCKDGCENRLTIWRMERRGALRERVFTPRNPWSDADVSWASNIRLLVEITEAGKSSAVSIDVSDARWTVLAP